MDESTNVLVISIVLAVECAILMSICANMWLISTILLGICIELCVVCIVTSVICIIVPRVCANLQCVSAKLVIICIVQVLVRARGCYEWAI